jgi:hypothetical protein
VVALFLCSAAPLSAQGQQSSCRDSGCEDTAQASPAQKKLAGKPIVDEYAQAGGRAEIRFPLLTQPDLSADLRPYIQVEDAQSGSSVPFGVLTCEKLLLLTGLEPVTAYTIRFRKGLPLSTGLLASEQLSEKGYFDNNESKLLHQQVITLQPNVHGEASLNVERSISRAIAVG